VTPGRPRVLFVSGSGSGNTLRYRVRMAEEALRATGVATAAVHFTDPQLRGWAQESDLLVLYRTPATRHLLGLVEHARTRLDIPVTFDVDDRVFLPEHLESVPFLDELPPAKRRLFEADVVRRGNAVRFVDRATGTTEPVVRDLARLTAATVAVLPNGVSSTGLALADRARRRDLDATVRLGYFSGSATHDLDWRVAEPAVVDLMANDPRIELWLVGPLNPGPALARLGDRVRLLPPVAWQDLPALLALVDINLAPLDVSPFTEGKSAIKWLEAALVRTPTVATATSPFADAVQAGADAVLVAPGEDWAEPLGRLVADAGLRRDLGDAARSAAVARFGPEVQQRAYRSMVDSSIAGPRAAVDLDLLRRLAGGEPRSRTWGLDLEAYSFPVGAPAGSYAGPSGSGALAQGRGAARAAARTAVRYARGARRRLRPR
jgi:glycosyltransferase involved in cell wall biosynthesis